MGFLVVPVAVYLLIAILSGLNIGYRHLLPIYPFLYVLAGGLAAPWARIGSRILRSAVAAVVLLVVPVSCLFVFSPPWRPAPVYPNYLAYFNELAGGPRNGYQSLVDSNLDWGQGLKELKGWLRQRGIKDPICLCYFGSADPRSYGIAYYDMPWADVMRQRNLVLKPGNLIAISATTMQGVYLSEEGRAALKQVLQKSKLVDTVGYSIFIFEYQPGLSTRRPLAPSP